MTVEHSHAAQVAQLRQLGKGGTATVFEAVVAGKRVALKRPRPEFLARRSDALALFEREYHTLAQLAHPNVVEVYGYAIDAEGPYYTMELLEGPSLGELAPMPWQRACGILCDVASALALVHSRRLVHRDVTLHNVRLNTAGVAKLMDFGALTPMGVAARTMGTAAYMAPEAVYRQTLDQRTDLYALGALGYRLLCGRDAYPARRIEQLRDAWRSRPRPLCELVPEVPPVLDELIRQLLSLNPDGRQRSAAEVFIRLSSLAGLPERDDGAIARAYLAAPSLVGREVELSAIRRRILQVMRGRGSAVLVEGVAGSGRSRLLDACIVDGQLIGAHVVRARPMPGSSALFGVLATLGAQIVEARPVAAPTNPRLRQLIGLNEGDGPFTPAPDEKASLQKELVTWLLGVADKPLLIIVDDVHLADMESAAVLVRLSEAAAKHALTLVVSALSGAQGSAAQAVRLLRERAEVLTLRPLEEHETLALVRSLFDDVVNVQLAAKRIHDIAQGNPQATVDLAEWLVDGSHVVYQGGRWLIPDTLSGLPLPSSVQERLRERLSSIGAAARRFAAAMAVAGDTQLSVCDYGVLAELAGEQGVQAALAELRAAHIVSASGEGYTFSQAAYRQLLIRFMDAEALASVHLRVAEFCLARAQIDWAIYHSFHGGVCGRALDLLLSRLREGASPTQILPSLEERVELMRDLLRHAMAEDRPKAEIFALQDELVKRAEIKVSLVRDELAALTQAYKALTGYDDWLALPAEMPAKERILQAMKAASERHHALPPHERVMDPQAALPRLVDFVSVCAAAAAANSDCSLIEPLPSLDAFAPLSEPVRLLARYLAAVEATVGGRADVASEGFISILAELEGEAAASLGPAADRLRRHAIIAVGMLNAGLSRSIALDYADRLDALAAQARDPYARSTSLRVRHLYHLRRGNFRQAQHWQHELEIDKLTDRQAVFNPSGIFALSWIHAMLGDIEGMRDCLRQMHEYSIVSEGLRTWETYMIAEYDRLRGATEQALPRYRAILDELAGRHMAWLYAAHGVLLCLEAQGRWHEGKVLGEQLLARANAAQLSVARGLILRPLGLIEARLGHFDLAVDHLTECIEQCIASGMGGINLGITYEFRARIAICAGDADGFQQFADACACVYRESGGSPELTARFDALLEEGRRANLIDESWRARDLSPTLLSHEQVELRDRLGDCDTEEARGLKALQAVAQSARAAGGHLYQLTADGLVLVASSDSLPAPAALSVFAAELLQSAADNDQHTESFPDHSVTESDVTGTITAGEGDRWRAETCEGFLPQPLFRSGESTPFGVFMLRPGARAPRRPDEQVLEVVAMALSSPLRAASRRDTESASLR